MYLALFDDFLQSSISPVANTSPTKNFFPGKHFVYNNNFNYLCSLSIEHPFPQTNTTSSNDANWGAFVETTKHPTTMVNNTPVTNTMSMPANNFAHPPPEPVSHFSFLCLL